MHRPYFDGVLSGYADSDLLIKDKEGARSTVTPGPGARDSGSDLYPA